MDHVAILRKSVASKESNLLKDIIDGKKTIESRWYVNKIAPWDRVKKGDAVYFKESGGLVYAKVLVSNVYQYEKPNKVQIDKIISEYGKKIAPSSSSADLKRWSKDLHNKNYCILIFLKNVEKVLPFPINKGGYGVSCAWMCVEDINRVKKS